MNKPNTLMDIKLLTELLNPQFIKNYYGSDSYEVILTQMDLKNTTENVKELKRSIIHTQYLLINERQIHDSEIYLEDDFIDAVVALTNIKKVYEKMLAIKEEVKAAKGKENKVTERALEYVNVLYRNKYFLKVNKQEKFNFQVGDDLVANSVAADASIQELLEQVLDFIQANEDLFEEELMAFLDAAVEDVETKKASKQSAK